ncbi:MAG: hypothetical protein HC846_06190 [Blastocatellia bacterium]|nr:hypothetical protein [Blastocatellia bacterium]
MEEAKQNLEVEFAQLKEDFAAQSKEFEKLISLKDTVIEDLQNNQEKIIGIWKINLPS